MFDCGHLNLGLFAADRSLILQFVATHSISTPKILQGKMTLFINYAYAPYMWILTHRSALSVDMHIAQYSDLLCFSFHIILTHVMDFLSAIQQHRNPKLGTSHVFLDLGAFSDKDIPIKYVSVI